MLSSLVITSQKFVLIIDNVGQERIAFKTIEGLLREQESDPLIEYLCPKDKSQSLQALYESFVNESGDSKNSVNILLPVLSDITPYHCKAELFQFLHKLKRNRNIKRIFLWATKAYLFDPLFTLACLEYLADLVLYIESKQDLSILTRKSGGSVTNKHYTYTKTPTNFQVQEIRKSTKKPDLTQPKPEQLGTFKIELEEDELVARNALKLPYEKTSVAECSGGGNIIYLPDKGDDFDDEDPDDDLYI